MPESADKRDAQVHIVRKPDELPAWITIDQLAEFMHESLKPFHDPLPAVKKGIEDAISPESPIANFILIAERDQKPVGGVVMLKTNMQAYIPEHLLLFIAVDPQCRGMGLGGRLLEQVKQECNGHIKLHVEYDNPAKRLYERVGFVNKYAEMRCIK